MTTDNPTAFIEVMDNEVHLVIVVNSTADADELAERLNHQLSQGTLDFVSTVIETN